MDFQSVLFTVVVSGPTFTKLALCISQGPPEKQNNGRCVFVCVCVYIYSYTIPI